MLYIGIPAHNEATTIGVLLWRLRSVLADVSREYEVVVYDDASTDETAKTLEPYTRVLPLTLLSGSRRVGYAGAVDALVRHVARTTRYPRRDALLLLQGDFTDPPALVPEFLKRFEGGADLIIGERASAGDAPTAVRRLWSASRWVLRPFVGVTDVSDLTSSYRLVRIAVLRELLKSVGDAPVATGDVWAANADFLLRTAALSRRVETIPVTPTFGVRTRETRRAAWPDTVALAKWGWGRRGQRVAVKVIARTVDVPAEVEEAPSEPVERVAPPERAERERRPRRDSGERGERTERTERTERSERSERSDSSRSGGERKSRERAPLREREARTERDPTTEVVSGGSLPDSEGESGESSSREGRPRRKRGRRDRTRKELDVSPAVDVAESTTGLTAPVVAAADTSPVTPERSSSRSAHVSPATAAAESERAEDENADAADGSDASDMSEDGVARRRKRTRRGRRRKSGSAGDATSGNESAEAPAAGGAPRAASQDVQEQEALGPREDTPDEGDSAAEDVASVKRRRSRRGRRGGARRRDGSGDGAGDALSESGAEGHAEGSRQDAESRGEVRRDGSEGADRSDP